MPPTDALLAPLAARLVAKADAADWRAEGAVPERLDAVRSRLIEADASTFLLDLAVAGDSPTAWALLSAAYRAAGTAADVLSAFAAAGHELRPGTPFADAVVAAAEAQSAVRSAYWALRGLRPDSIHPEAGHDDPDQVDLCRWLREAVRVDGVRIARHLIWRDPADPTRAGGVKDHLTQMAARAGLSLRTSRPTADARALDAASYHAKRLAQGGWDADHQRTRLLECVAAATCSGVSPTDVRLREVLLPVAEDLPPADAPMVPAPVSHVLRALHAYLSSKDVPSTLAVSGSAPRPDHLVRAARLLRGLRVALFGGVPRQAAIDALMETLELGDLEWIETRVHQSTRPFDAVVSRSDIAIQLVRFSSHSFGELREQCARHGAVFVRAPRGYSPSAIATAVLEQVSGDLARRRSSTA